MSNTRINFWSGPRNLSTAIMYSFSRRSDTTVVDEPFYACYLKMTGKDHPGKDLVLSSQNSEVSFVLQQVIMAEYPKPVVFFKQMAHHVSNLDLSFCKDCKNVILLRHPENMIVSLFKILEKPEIRDLGLPDLLHIYKYLKENKILHAVFDSGELLKDPKQMLQKLCTALDLPFESAMLSWPSGPKKEDGSWAPYWYKNVHLTTGFAKITHLRSASLNNEQKSLLKKCMPLYDQMVADAITLNID